MNCLKCGGGNVEVHYAHKTSDQETFYTYRSIIPLTGLLAIGLKHLLCEKSKCYICKTCQVGWWDGQIVYWPAPQE